MKHMLAWLAVNPIIVKELRSRMRGGRAFLTLTLSLLLTGGILYGLLQVMISLSAYSSDILSPRIGQSLFMVLAYLELAIVCAVTPAVTAGAISGEREKLTYDLLRATPLKPSAIVWGKLVSALSYVFLLLFAAVPLSSLVFIFGGVALRDMAKVALVLLVLMGAFGMLGVFMSALFKRTGRATVFSYLVVLALVFVPVLLTIIIGLTQQGSFPRWILAISPISVLASVIGTSNFVGPLYEIIPFLGGYWMQNAITPVTMVGIPRPLYHYTLPAYTGGAMLLYLLATRLMQPSRRWTFRRTEALAVAGVGLVFAGLVAGLFLGTANRYEWVPAAPTSMPAAQPEMNLNSGEALTEERPAVIGTIEITPVGTITVTPPPGGTQGTPVPSAMELDEAARAQIYEAVARQIFTIENNFTSEDNAVPTLYVVGKTDDRAADPAGESNSSAIPEGVRGKLQEQLADLKARLVWVEDRQMVPLDAQTNRVVGGGLILTLGNIRSGENGTVLVPGSLYADGLAARGTTYVVEQQGGQWVVIGTTGAAWVS